MAKKTVKVVEVKKSTRIEKNHNEAFMAGVCSGIADYFGIDVTFLRFLFFLSVFGYGFGIVMYIILSICLPSDEKNSWGYNNKMYW